jgi:hypothetical protein
MADLPRHVWTFAASCRVSPLDARGGALALLKEKIVSNAGARRPPWRMDHVELHFQLRL